MSSKAGEGKQFIQKIARQEAALHIADMVRLVGITQGGDDWDFGCLDSTHTKATLQNGAKVNAVVSGKPNQCGPCVLIGPNTYYFPGAEIPQLSADGGVIPYVIYVKNPGSDTTRTYHMRKFLEETVYQFTFPLGNVTNGALPSPFDSGIPIFRFNETGSKILVYRLETFYPDAVHSPDRRMLRVYWTIINSFTLVKSEDPSDPEKPNRVDVVLGKTGIYETQENKIPPSGEAPEFAARAGTSTTERNGESNDMETFQGPSGPPVTTYDRVDSDLYTTTYAEDSDSYWAQQAQYGTYGTYVFDLEKAPGTGAHKIAAIQIPFYTTAQGEPAFNICIGANAVRSKVKGWKITNFGRTFTYSFVQNYEDSDNISNPLATFQTLTGELTYTVNDNTVSFYGPIDPEFGSRTITSTETVTLGSVGSQTVKTLADKILDFNFGGNHQTTWYGGKYTGPYLTACPSLIFWPNPPGNQGGLVGPTQPPVPSPLVISGGDGGYGSSFSRNSDDYLVTITGVNLSDDPEYEFLYVGSSFSSQGATMQPSVFNCTNPVGGFMKYVDTMHILGIPTVGSEIGTPYIRGFGLAVQVRDKKAGTTGIAGGGGG